MTKEQAIQEALRNKSYFPYRIHTIYSEAGGATWETDISLTMARPNNRVRKGFIVERLRA